MAWIKPKIDWVATDYFNASDYNRIVGNVLFLEELSHSVIGTLDFYGMTEEKANLELLYADEMNSITQNIKMMNVYSFDDSLKICNDNGTFLTYIDLNKLEALIYMLYITMKSQISFIKRLSFRLGNRFNVPRQIEEDYSTDLYRIAYILGQKGDVKP